MLTERHNRPEDEGGSVSAVQDSANLGNYLPFSGSGVDRQTCGVVCSAVQRGQLINCIYLLAPNKFDKQAFKHRAASQTQYS